MTSEHTFNLSLVKEVEKYPCLYNYTTMGYTFKDVTDKAWANVSKALNISVNDCKDRWKNLRAVYIRHKKRAKYGTMMRRKPYYLEEAMEFTLPYIKILNSTPSPGNTSATYDVVYDDPDEDSKPDQVQSPDQCRSEISSPQEQVDNQFGKRPNEGNYELQDYLGYKTSRVLDNLDPQRDANTMFLLSLLPDLNEMSKQEIWTFKKKVLDIIHEILVANATTMTKVKVEDDK